MRKIFSVPEKRAVQLYCCYGSDSFDQLNRANDSTLQDAGLYAGQSIVIEICNEDGTWLRPRQSSKQ